MPDPNEILLGEVNRSTRTLLSRIDDSQQQIARLGVEMRDERDALSAATASGNDAAVKRAQRKVDALTAKIEGARADRVALDRDHAALVDRLALRDSCDAPADVPLLLLPVRIETRFNPAGNALRIRIYPDEIHIDRLDRGLSADENAAGQAYWMKLWSATVGEKGDTDRAAAWNALVAAVGASRAHWIARATTPDNAASLGVGAPTFPAPPPPNHAAALARLLPDRFVAIADQKGKRSKAVGSPIPPNVRVGLLSKDDQGLADQDGLTMLPGTEWLADFDLAVAKGLALTLPLTGAGPIDRLVVAGVSRSRDPAKGAADFSALLESHWESDGLSFLPQGTPTNNTETVRSAWHRRQTMPAPSMVDSPGPSDSNAATLIAALGIDAAWLSDVDHALDDEQGAAAAMNTALWPATLGQFLDAVDANNEALSPVVIDRIRLFHHDHVRGRGPIPALRVGRQPYAVLPVSNFATRWTDAPADKFGGQLTTMLRKVRPNWLGVINSLAHVGSRDDLRDTMDRLLGQAAVSYGVRARKCLSGNMINAIGEVTKTASDAANIEAMLSRMLAEAIGNFSYRSLGATLDDKARPVLLPYADETRDSAFLTALLATGDGGKISSVFQALVALAAERVKAKRPPGRDFLDHLRASATLAPALREAVATQLTQSDRSDASAINTLRMSLPGANDPAQRPAARSFAMDGFNEPQFAAFFDTVSTAAARDFLTVQVVDEFLRTSETGAEFRTALDRLSKPLGDATIQTRHTLVAESLDTVSHRLDAWITATVSRRLASQRAVKSAGLTVGAFGYVENLRPQGRDARSGGYILSPSLAHATTAGILRAAHIGNRTPAGARNPYAIGLSSARVRDALHLVDGVRQGQPLGALLGYRIERALQDAKLGYLILSLRSLVPLTQGKLSDRGAGVSDEAQEAIAAANVTDGLRLVELWRGANGPNLIRTKLGQQPANNPYLPVGTDWPAYTAAIRAKVEGAIGKLDESVDAVADLLLAESVHQVAQGNLARASAAMDAAGRGDVAPPEPDFVSSLRGGQPVSHRLLIIGRDGGWNPQAPRARLSPGLEGWAAERLGDPALIVVGYRDGDVPVRLSDGSMSALDLVALSDDAASAVRRAAGSQTVDIAVPQDPRLAANELALSDALLVADSMRRLIVGARVAGGGDFGLPGALAAHEPDPVALASLLTTINEVANLLGQRRATLDALTGTPSVGVGDLSAALVAMTDFGIATPSVALKQLGETALLAVAEADRRLAAFAALATAPGDAEGLAQRARALFGHDFTLLIPQALSGNPTFEVALDPIVQPSKIRGYLGDIATVRAQVRMYGDHLLLCDSIGIAPRLAVMQLGGGPGRWIAEPLPEGAAMPTSAIISIIADAPEQMPGTLSGLVIDDWTESFPRRAAKGTGDDAHIALDATIALAINANAPNTQPPQTMLLGVSPDGQRWSDDRVFELVGETIDMAKMRLVTLESVPLAARLLPTIYTQSWSLQGEKTIDWSKFGDVFLREAVVGSPLRAFSMVEEN